MLFPKRVVFSGLKYIATYTIENFKAIFNCTRIDVKVNPKTEELFFSYGCHTGYVALKWKPIAPVISVVINSAGSLFLLLHEKKIREKQTLKKVFIKDTGKNHLNNFLIQLLGSMKKKIQ